MFETILLQKFYAVSLLQQCGVIEIYRIIINVHKEIKKKKI